MTLVIAVIILIFLGIILDQRWRTRRMQAAITNSWGKIKGGYINMAIVSKFNSYHTHKNSQRLSSQTLKDIDIESLFGFLDRTNSGIGMQMLYSRICQPGMDISQLEQLSASAAIYEKDKFAREKTQFLLRSMEQGGTSLIADIFDPAIQNKTPTHKSYIRLLSIMAVIIIPVFIAYPGLSLLIAMIFILGLNLNLHFYYRHRNRTALQTIRQVYRLQKYAARLSKLRSTADVNNAFNLSQPLRRFKKLYWFLDLGIPMNDVSAIAFYLLDLVRGCLLLEVHLLDYTYNEMLKQRLAIKTIFIYLGDIDCALSIASVKSTENLVTCKPIFVSTPKTIDFKDAVHPLIIDCQANSICLENKSALITGSNMSGKSTFLRTIMLNLVLARSLNICFAKEARISMSAAFSSISIADDLSDSKSFYLQEVNVIREMIVVSKGNRNNVFIIDEIFKGTNTKERIALASSILHYLDSPTNLVIASSHDIQLTELAGDGFKQFHFYEQISEGQMHFNFHIQDGPSGTGNAIKLAELVGYPDEIIDSAKERIVK